MEPSSTLIAEHHALPTTRPVAPSPKPTTPIKWWAALGGIWLAFMVYVIGKWVTGPYFERVPAGPSDPPTWMKVELIAWQVISIPIALAVLYWFLVRPWRRERRITTPGLLALVCLSLDFQDPLSNYFDHWFTYNSYMWNRGSWVTSIPGWVAPERPGAMLVEPILWGPGTTLWMFLALVLLGSAVMTRISARWPRVTKVQLAAICFVLMVVLDTILEGFLFMPLGIYAFGGGRWTIFPEAYHRFGMFEGIFVAAFAAPITCLWHFRNDRGETIVERGVERLSGGTGRKAVVRFLALLGICQTIMFVGYTVPVAVLIGAHPSDWPADITTRSYFTNGLCGQGTDRACPGPDVPMARGNDSPYLTRDGGLGVPPASELPKPVPFNDGKRGPFSGPLF